MKLILESSQRPHPSRWITSPNQRRDYRLLVKADSQRSRQ